MKKSLLVLAVAAAVPVLAQAQTNVTLYGRVDAAVGSESRGTSFAGVNGGSAISLLSGLQSSNRWGVRGSEDLGGGLKAIFNLEGGFDADIGRGFGATGQATGVSNTTGGFASGTPGTTTGANTSGGLDFRRRSVVGLEGGFGNLVFGRDYDPLFRVLLGSDTLGLGHYNNVHTIFTTGYGVRIDNGIHYVTPNFGGIQARVAYGLSENFIGTAQTALVPSTTTTAVVAANAGNAKNTGRAISAALEYAAGPLYVGLGYRGNTVNAPAGVGFIPNTGTSKYTAIGARYNFGAFAVNAGAGKNDPFGAGNNIKSFWVGGDAQIGPGRLHAQFGSLKNEVGGGKASSLGLTYNYPLSKRTNAYATLGQMRNNSTAGYSLSTSSTFVSAAGAGADPRGIALGVGHNF
jgi:predicted porin